MKQRRIAANHVHQQTLVGIRRTALERLGVIERQRHRPHPNAAGARALFAVSLQAHLLIRFATR